MRRPGIAAVIVVVSGWRALAAAAGQEAGPTVPVHQEPRHHLVFESAAVRILDVQIPPGDTTLFHTHDGPILYVPIVASTTRAQVLGAEWPAGAPIIPSSAPPLRRTVYSVTSYVDTPLTHRVNNLGLSLFRLIGIANRTKGSADGGDDVSGVSAKPELENAWYRAHRVSLEAGAATSAHRHATPVVVVLQTPGTAVSEGSVWTSLDGPGDYAWHDGTGAHTVRNRGGSTVEFVEIEVRGAGK